MEKTEKIKQLNAVRHWDYKPTPKKGGCQIHPIALTTILDEDKQKECLDTVFEIAPSLGDIDVLSNGNMPQYCKRRQVYLVGNRQMAALLIEKYNFQLVDKQFSKTFPCKNKNC